MTDRDKLKEAQGLIQSRRFDEARLLLMTMPNNQKAVDWLSRLNTESPPSDPMLMAQVRDTIHGVIDEQERRERSRRTRGCMVRFGLFALYLMCSCITILPILTIMSNAAGDNSPSWLSVLTDNPVSDQVNAFAQEQIIERTIQNAAPVISSAACDGQGLTGQALQLCRSIITDLQSCLEEGVSLGVCTDRVVAQACRATTGNDEAAYQLCVEQASQLSPLLP